MQSGFGARTRRRGARGGACTGVSTGAAHGRVGMARCTGVGPGVAPPGSNNTFYIYMELELMTSLRSSEVE